MIVLELDLSPRDLLLFSASIIGTAVFPYDRCFLQDQWVPRQPETTPSPGKHTHGHSTPHGTKDVVHQRILMLEVSCLVASKGLFR